MRRVIRCERKGHARNFLSNSRKSIPEFLRQLAGQSVATLASGVPEVFMAGAVALYQDVPPEVPTGPLVEFFAVQTSAEILFPTWRAQRWCLCRWSPEREMYRGRYGILVPAGPIWRPKPGELLVAFVPVVGWGLNGLRLGRGAGAYDQLLRSVAAQGSVFVVGVGYEAQQVQGVDPESWDFPLDLIITEKRIIRLPHRGL